MTAAGIIRRQLSLFAPEPWATRLDEIRAVLDPVQHHLIAAHVTVCRDEEVEALLAGDLAGAIAAARRGPITLGFGRAVAFDGHGVLLPCVAGEEELASFRARLLGASQPRRQIPHITLAHPRNPKAAGNDLAATRSLPSKIEIEFGEACVIEQRPGDVWRALRRFPLQ